jgi:hypothetical protein
MELSLIHSRSGGLTCSARGVWLHSRYEPDREARRFALSSIGESRPSSVLLLGPCLDYLSPAIRSILPGARIVSIQFSSDFSGLALGEPDASWYPSSGIGLEDFVDTCLDEDSISGVAVLEWEPAIRAFPEAASAARKAVASSLDRLASSTATVKSMGKRWIANACASFLQAGRACIASPTEAPVLIVAAGPSLRPALSSIAGSPRSFYAIAVSSALAACRAAGLEPDIVVSTDGGYWSRLHLYSLASHPLPLATALTALPSASIYGSSPILLLDQGSFAESELLPGLGSRPLAIPAHGTVSGTALRLASRLTSGPVIAAGLDLASIGAIDHASPHGFDSILSAGVSRLSPQEGRTWQRGMASSPLPLPGGAWRSSRSLLAYASALRLDALSMAGRLFRLYPSPVELPGFGALDARGFSELVAASSGRERPLAQELSLPEAQSRNAFLSERLASWKERAAAAAADMGRGRLPDRGIAELLRSIDIVDYAASRRAALGGGNPAPAALDLERACVSFISRLERSHRP